MKQSQILAEWLVPKVTLSWFHVTVRDVTCPTPHVDAGSRCRCCCRHADPDGADGRRVRASPEVAARRAQQEHDAAAGGAVLPRHPRRHRE